MFTRVTIGEKHKADVLDLGQLVEALVFFKEVNLVTNRKTLPELVSFFGIENVPKVQKDFGLNIYYSDSPLGVLNKPQIGFVAYAPTRISLVGDFPYDGILTVALDKYGKSGKSRRKARSIANNIKSLPNSTKVQDIAVGIINKDANTFIRQILQTDLPTNQFREIDMSRVFFNVEEVAKGDYIWKANEYTLRILEKGNYKFPSIFANILGFVDKVEASKEIGADINLHEHGSAKYFERLISEELSVYLPESKIKKDFYKHIVYEAPTISELVNNKSIKLNEIIGLIDGSRKFKELISNLNEDQNVVREYISKIQELPIISSLPAKLIRFGISTGLGFLNPALGVGAGVIDSFIMDGISGGWKPNTYVNRVKDLQTRGK